MKSPRLLLLLAAVPGIAAAWGVLELTEPPGPGLDPDALSYLGAGLSLARGAGLRVPSAGWASADTSAPLVHFPPGFSVAIALGIRLDATPTNAARFVEATAACISVMAILLAAGAAGGLTAAVLVGVITAATPGLMVVHASVLSEPLFLALLACFVCVFASERYESETRRAIILSALAATAVLVRYVGVSLVAALALEALLASPGSAAGTSAQWRLRARRAMVATVIPIAALGAWVFSRPRAAGTERIREAGLYLRGLPATLAEGTGSVVRWLAPGVAPDLAMNFVAVAILAGVIALVVRETRTAAQDKSGAAAHRLFHAIAIIAPCYVLTLGASRLLADPGIPFDDRLLSPLFLLAALAIGVALARWWQAVARAGSRGAALFSLGITASWIAGATQANMQLVQEFRADGADLASSEWRLSPLVDWASSAPPGMRLYSNWPAAIWFHTGRAAFELPAELDSISVKAFGAKLAMEHAAVLGFREPSPDMASPDSLAARAGLTVVARWPEGTIWMSPGDSLERKDVDRLLVFRIEQFRVREKPYTGAAARLLVSARRRE
ncbi:MAG TPA: hypothetical protein VHE78_09470 [Gemmatimonadaceae bacterium]|nr:hypothetical protein [Gemmatimonadaceae bacterium]